MTEKIDFVITWVDGNDKEWQKEKKKYDINKEKNESNEVYRYREWDLLKYWFRGVEKFAPWVNKIHFITYGHFPDWLDTTNPKLNIVNHNDIIPKEYLPTFNSNVIELCMHKIEGLENQFVYFNDDVYLVSNTKKHDFFLNGIPRDNLIYDSIDSLPDNENLINHIILNNMNIITHNFVKKDIKVYKLFSFKNGKQNIKNILLLPYKNFTSFYNPHIAISYKKEDIDMIWKKEEKRLKETLKNKFRTEKDCSHWVYRYWNLASGNFKSANLKKYKYYPLSNNNEQLIKDIKKGNRKIICINDSNPNINFEEVKGKLKLAFDKILLEKCSFEKR